jgi:hypothetical protein
MKYIMDGVSDTEIINKYSVLAKKSEWKKNLWYLGVNGRLKLKKSTNK